MAKWESVSLKHIWFQDIFMWCGALNIFQHACPQACVVSTERCAHGNQKKPLTIYSWSKFHQNSERYIFSISIFGYENSFQRFSSIFKAVKASWTDNVKTDMEKNNFFLKTISAQNAFKMNKAKPRFDTYFSFMISYSHIW